MIISAVIRVRNAEYDLEKCLFTLKKQYLGEKVYLEIIVVDNESTDGSVKIAEKFCSKILHLSVKEFSWGRALNRGIQAANGEIILLLSADAYPAATNWIMQMIAPFAHPLTVAVYARQIPRQDAPIDEM